MVHGARKQPRCGVCGHKLVKNGQTSAGRTRWRCRACGRQALSTAQMSPCEPRHRFSCHGIWQECVSNRWQCRQPRLPGRSPGAGISLCPSHHWRASPIPRSSSTLFPQLVPHTTRISHESPKSGDRDRTCIPLLNNPRSSCGSSHAPHCRFARRQYSNDRAK